MIPELRTNLVDRIGKYASLRKIAAHEWAGPCPRCGGTDRFRVHDEKGWFCRTCQGAPGDGSAHWGDLADFMHFLSGWTLRETLHSMGMDRKLTPAEIAALEAERKAAQEQQRAEEQAKQAAVHQQLTDCGDWWTHNQNLDKYPEAREMWNRRGVSDSWIEYYRLGFCKGRDWWGRFTSDSLTIPYFRPIFKHNPQGGDDVTWQVVNLKHRLLMDNPPMGKYLPDRAGAGNHLFFTDLHQRNVSGDLLIVEGEIKAIVTWATLWIGEDCLFPNFTVIGVPGHGWREEWLEQFNRAERVFVCLDPDNDAQKAAKRLVATLGTKAKNILLPDKIDDLITAGVLDGFKLVEILEA